MRFGGSTSDFCRQGSRTPIFSLKPVLGSLFKGDRGISVAGLEGLSFLVSHQEYKQGVILCDKFSDLRIMCDSLNWIV